MGSKYATEWFLLYSSPPKEDIPICRKLYVAYFILNPVFHGWHRYCATPLRFKVISVKPILINQPSYDSALFQSWNIFEHDVSGLCLRLSLTVLRSLLIECTHIPVKSMHWDATTHTHTHTQKKHRVSFVHSNLKCDHSQFKFEIASTG